jgi:dTDP-4-amino-4,6-dideoxygalactose transaminase
MKISRVKLFTPPSFYLNIILGFFKNYKNDFIKKISFIFKKKNFLLFSQGRVAFYNCLKLEMDLTGKKEVIISPYTLPAVINVIELIGAKPIYVDIDINTGLPKIEHVKKKITKNTLAIVITHLFSSERNIKKFLFFVKRNSLCLIEDCAINFGCIIRNKKKTTMLGTLGEYGFFSFGMMKNICLLNAGALYVKDKKKYNLIKSELNKKKFFPFFKFLNLFFLSLLINFLFSKFIYNLFTFFIIRNVNQKNSYLIKKIYPGLFPQIYKKIPEFFNYDFFSPLAKAGIFQLKKFQSDHFARIQKIKIYEKYLKDCKNLDLFKFNNYYENSFLEYPILLKNKTNTYIHDKLSKSGIDIRKKWYLNNLTIKTFNKNKLYLKNCDFLSKKILCLPVHSQISIDDIKEISFKIKQFA